MIDLQGHLAARMKGLRHERGWSQEKLAEHADLHRTYIGGIETSRHNVSLRNIGKLAHAFGLTPSELLRFGEGSKAREEAEAALFILLREFPLKELRFVNLLLKVLLRWKKAAAIRS